MSDNLSRTARSNASDWLEGENLNQDSSSTIYSSIRRCSCSPQFKLLFLAFSPVMKLSDKSANLVTDIILQYSLHLAGYYHEF